ncbi:MAG: CDP-diacylglycerol O-phosphatidyltransferase [Acidobacteria bacterium]|nr:CDP-diacylglycerol O-phosphatidyltransferase [Acidobacteriota bacterium]
MTANLSAQPLAWLVHFYTASGAVLAFAATLAAFEGRFRGAFLCLVAATVVDASDGMLARYVGIPHATPRFDGARLDDIVDYLTFVFVPMVILYRAGNLPEGWGFWVAAAVLLSSGYGFASLDAKTSDYFFTGFPSYWNIVALYLHAAGTPDLFNAVLLLALVVMVFVRIGYVYPSRTPVLRGLTNLLGVLWAAMMLAVVWLLPSVPRVVLVVSLFFPVYYTGLSFWLHAKRPQSMPR